MKSIFGCANKELENARNRKGLSRKDVAIKLGLSSRSEAAIRDWEHGLIVPEKHRKKLIELYGLDKKCDC